MGSHEVIRKDVVQDAIFKSDLQNETQNILHTLIDADIIERKHYISIIDLCRGGTE